MSNPNGPSPTVEDFHELNRHLRVFIQQGQSPNDVWDAYCAFHEQKCKHPPLHFKISHIQEYTLYLMDIPRGFLNCLQSTFLNVTFKINIKFHVNVLTKEYPSQIVHAFHQRVTAMVRVKASPCDYDVFFTHLQKWVDEFNEDNKDHTLYGGLPVTVKKG